MQNYFLINGAGEFGESFTDEVRCNESIDETREKNRNSSKAKNRKREKMLKILPRNLYSYNKTYARICH